MKYRIETSVVAPFPRFESAKEIDVTQPGNVKWLTGHIKWATANLRAVTIVPLIAR